MQGLLGLLSCHVVNTMESFHSHDYSECCTATVLAAKHKMDHYIVKLKWWCVAMVTHVHKFSHGPV